MKIIIFFFSLFFLANSAWAATYYVSKSGSDANSCVQAQKISTPKLTINGGIGCMSGGDTLEIRNGTFVEFVRDIVPSGVSESQNTTIKNYSNEKVTVEPPSAGERLFWIGGGKKYITIDGLIFDAQKKVNTPFAIEDLQPLPENITVKNVSILNGINSGAFASGFNHKFQNCTVAGNGILGTGRDHGLYVDFKNSLIENCRIYENAAWGIHAFHQDGGEQYLFGNVFRNNILYDNVSGGIIISNGNNFLVYNNITYNNGNPSEWGGIRADFFAVDSKIYNNTSYRDRVGYIIGQGASNISLKNNITFQSGEGISNSGSGTIISNNLISDPKFINASENNFHLLSNSSARNAGATLYEVSTDFDGVIRPQDHFYDIGAFEYIGQTSSDTTPPSAPGNVVVQ